MRRCFRLFVLACIGVAIGSGCASPQMKGTPFYTGEYSVPQGPAENRVNLWPLLYYREPALSIMWPVGELTEDHLAIRPLMSIYDRDKEDPVYNVLWPLARFDTQSHKHRIFPIFWGNDYVVGFPLYWHFDDPWGEGGYDGLLPLWSYRSRGDGRYSTHLLWPFLHAKHWTDEETGWRVWPLIGSYADHGDRYRFAAWPLGHQWSSAAGKRGGSCLFPLYFNAADARSNESLFLSLPYSQRVSSDVSWETVLPLYHHRKTASSEAFFSLLYSAGTDNVADEEWNLLVPLWYAKRTGDDARLIATLLGGYSRKGEAKSWVALPLLSGGRTSKNSGDAWMVGPLAHVGWNGEYGSHHILPLYYRSRSETGKRFYSLLWSSGEDTDGGNWQMLLPLMYRQCDVESKTLITPLYAQGTADHGETKWKSIIPLVYNRKTQDEHLIATLLGGTLKRDDALTWLLYPLLSGGKVSEKEGSFWAVAPFVHARWNESGSTHHLLPLYYWDGWDDTFVSLPLARWKHDAATTTMIPPTLSWMTQREKRSDLWMLGPLAHFSWGADAASSHVFPLYAYRKRDYCFTPLVGWNHDRDGFIYPLTPLVGVRRGDYSGGWIFPLWSRREHRKTGEVSGTFLWGEYWRRGKRSGSSILPFYGYENFGVPPDRRDSANPGYGKYGKHFWSLPICWYRNETSIRRNTGASKDTVPTLEHHVKKHGAFPLWHYSRSERSALNRENVNASLLLLLYDYKREVRSGDAMQASADYTRARILWRLWHYERINGDVSVDVFPAITYDKKVDGFRKVSFLWRLFRYENGPKGKKVDLLFLPLVRKGSR